MLPVVRLELRSLRRPHLDESGVRTPPRPRLHHRLDRRARRRRRARIRARLRTQQHRFPDRRGARRRDRLDGRPPAHPAPGPEVLAVWPRGSGRSRRSRARRPSARGLRWHGWRIGSRTVVRRLPEPTLARSGAIPGERDWIRPRAASRARAVPLAAWPARHDDVLALQLESCSPRLLRLARQSASGDCGLSAGVLAAGPVTRP